MDITADKLVRAYIKMRDARAALKAKYEEEDNAIKEQMGLIETNLLETCKATGAESIKTAHGTAIRTMNRVIWT